MARLRFRLSADPNQLAGFDSDAGLEQARSRLRRTRDDVELTHVEQLAPDAVGVVFLAAAGADGDEIDDIAAELRTALGIGPGTNQRVSRNERHVTDDEDFIGGVVRGIGGESAMCSACGLGGGRHLSGCPRAD